MKDWKTPLRKAYFSLLNDLPVTMTNTDGTTSDFAVPCYHDVIPPVAAGNHGSKNVYIVIQDAYGSAENVKGCFDNRVSMTVQIVAFDELKQVSRREVVNAVANLVLSQINQDFDPELLPDFNCVTTRVESDDDGFDPGLTRWITWRNIRFEHYIEELNMGSSFDMSFDHSHET